MPDAAEKREQRLLACAVERLKLIAWRLRLTRMRQDRICERQGPAVVKELGSL